MSKRHDGFTLAELLVAVSVLTLLVLLFARLINSATTTTTLANKRMDADSVSRPLLDRLAADFASMVKRTDISCYAKNSATSPSMAGNDLIAFYGTTVGYFPSTPSPVSVIAYRVNGDSSNTRAYNRLERMAKGLDWNGSTDKPVLFLPLTIDDPAAWPSVASGSAYDSTDPTQITYEVIAPQVFRFEYYFIEKSTGALVAFPATWTSSLNVKLAEVSAIVVAIAVIDPQSQVLVTSSQLADLATSLPDYNSSMGPGQLLAQWQSVLNSNITLPQPARSGIRLYERYFPLTP
jgi:prepilin-type N-terminal cleavage/methylation domain-containing protein